MLGKFRRARKSSAADEPGAPAGSTADAQGAPQSAEPDAVVVTPVEATTASGAPTVAWAALGTVTLPNAVPARPTFIDAPTGLSEVSAATVARITGAGKASRPPSDDAS